MAAEGAGIFLPLKKTGIIYRMAQILHYLKATGLTLGLLINFGSEKVEFKRLIKSGNKP